MKLYLIVFSTVNAAQVFSYVENVNAVHYHSDGFEVTNETRHRWAIDNPPAGMPKVYRKTDEYRVMNNGSGIYMFGRDPERLVDAWNTAVVA